MAKLTKRQEEILSLIQRHVSETGSPPTRAEIARSMGFKSPNAAEDHLRALARKGVIELVPGTSRGIRLPAARSGIPLVYTNQLDLSVPIASQLFNAGSCKVDAQLLSASISYVLGYRQSDLLELGIKSGDYLLVHETPSAQPGQIVLSRAHRELVLQRLVEPMPFAALEGIVVGTLRTFAPLTTL